MKGLGISKILGSIALIAFTGTVAVSATGAFFSDTESSTGNTFTAGSIDLSIGSQSTSSYNGINQFGLLADNDGRTLFTFTDLKPGDTGQGVFDLQVTSNEAYACAKQTFQSYPENNAIEPETEAGDNANNGANDGELQNYLQFATFADINSNNVFDLGEPLNTLDGNGFSPNEAVLAGWIPVADPTTPNTWLTIGSMQPNVTYKAGFIYCFGNIDPVTGACTQQPGNQNVAQTDGISGSIEFQAIQTRNNAAFTCSSLNPQP